MKWIKTNPYKTETYRVICAYCREHIACEKGFYSCTLESCDEDYHKECFDKHMLQKQIAD